MNKDTEDFIKFIKTFIKNPILPSQEATIICLMMDGTINKNGAKELRRHIVNSNIKKHNEFMNMSQEEILALMDQYGIEYK